MTEPHTTAAPGTGMFDGARLSGSTSGFHSSGRRYGPLGRSARLAARFAVVALLAGILVLAGCSSPPTAAPSATMSTPPPAATAPPTTPGPYKPATAEGPAENVPVPVLPDAAKEFSKEGLVAFTEYWYSTLGYAFETGDPQPMLESSSTTCEACNTMAETVVPWHEAGRWILGGQMIILSTNATFEPGSDGSYVVTALVRQDGVQFYRADKSLADAPGQGPSAADEFHAVHGANGWSVSKILRIQG